MRAFDIIHDRYEELKNTEEFCFRVIDKSVEYEQAEDYVKNLDIQCSTITLVTLFI